MECPHCQIQMEIPDLWEFFDCANCGASLQLENNELKILKSPSEKTSSHQQPIHQDTPESQNTSPTKPMPEQAHVQNLSDKDDSLSSAPSKDLSSSPDNSEFSQNPQQSIEDSSPTEPPPETAHEDLSEIPQNSPSQSVEDISENNNEQVFTENEAHSPSFEQSENLSNILDFEHSPNQKNHFTYYLQISSISSKALLDKIQSIFKSPRLKLDQPSQSKNNSLAVNNLNAVQMVYILRKLSPLPVQIHWRQKSTLTE